jgi:hypothetical protein
MWYRREESQKRITFFYSATTLAGAFGGLIATGIGHMDHLRGYRAWRWIFIVGESICLGYRPSYLITMLEGLVTAVLAIAWFFLLPDFPEEASFLSDQERDVVQRRLRADVGASAHEISYSMRDVLSVFRDCTS